MLDSIFPVFSIAALPHFPVSFFRRRRPLNSLSNNSPKKRFASAHTRKIYMHTYSHSISSVTVVMLPYMPNP